MFFYIHYLVVVASPIKDVITQLLPVHIKVALEPTVGILITESPDSLGANKLLTVILKSAGVVPSVSRTR